MYVKTQRSWNCKNSEKKSWKIRPTWLHNLLKCYRNKSKQCGTHIKADTQREPSSQTDPNIHSPLTPDKCAVNAMEKGQSCHKWPWDNCRSMCENTLQVLPHIEHKMDSKCKHKHSTIKLLKSNIANYLDLELKIS